MSKSLSIGGVSLTPQNERGWTHRAVLSRDALLQVFRPLLTGLAQVYGSDRLEVGALILGGMAVASPIIAVHCVLGELVSVFTGECCVVAAIDI